MQNVKEEIVNFKQRFDAVLFEIIENEITKGSAVSPELGWLLTSMKNTALAGGKRLRPFLFYYGYKGLVDEHQFKEENVLRLSAFVELVHLELLVLDDIMDNSPTRHGIETIHQLEMKKFAHDHGVEGAVHFGTSAAILAGIIFGNISMKILAEVGAGAPDRALALVEYYNTVIIETAYGQYHDMLVAAKPAATEEEIQTIHLYKTAKYTIEAPLVAAAIFAGKSEEEISTISDFSLPLGISFQIVDDLIGTFGDEDQTGKSVKSDAEEGKHTFLTVKALEVLPVEERSEFVSLLRKGKLSDADFEIFKDAIIETGSKKYSQVLAGEYLKKSLQFLGNTPYNDSVQGKFAALAEFIVHRNY